MAAVPLSGSRRSHELAMAGRSRQGCEERKDGRKDEKANALRVLSLLSSSLLFTQALLLTVFSLRFKMSYSVSVSVDALTAAGAALRAASAVCLDVDSTVCTDEGIDKLAAACGVGEEVAAWSVSLCLIRASCSLQRKRWNVREKEKRREKEKEKRERERGHDNESATEQSLCNKARDQKTVRKCKSYPPTLKEQGSDKR